LNNSRRTCPRFFSGTNKIVIRFGRYVVKMPNLFNDRATFFYGLYSNNAERPWKGYTEAAIPKIYWISLLGFFSIQEYCRPLSNEEWNNIEVKISESVYCYKYAFDIFEDVDHKRENYGYSKITKRIVLVDYI